MSRMAGESLTKITMNIYEEDYLWLKRRYGQGYSTEIREAVRAMVVLRKQRSGE